CQLAGGDPSAISLVHPLRWAGSWHKKATPRLAHIIAFNPAAKITLAETLNKLREATENPPEAPKTRIRTQNKGGLPQAPSLDVRAALACIPNDDACWKEWCDTGLEIFAATGGSPEGLAAFHGWSSKSPKYNAATTDARWANFAKYPPTRTGA